MLFAPFLAIVVAALVAFALEGVTGGGLVGMGILVLVALLLAYQVIQSIRDLFSEPVEAEGVIERLWRRNELLIFRNSYVLVAGDVYRITPEQELHVALGDTVRVRHYPHTSTLEAIEVLARREQAATT